MSPLPRPSETATARRSLRHYGPGLIAALLGVALVWTAAHIARGEALAREESRVREALSGARAQLGAVGEASFGATANLLSLIRVQGGLSEAAFHSTAETMLQGQTQLRNVAVAPDDVIAYLHPRLANERAMGLDYRNVPEQWAQIDRARQLRAPLIFAPVQLVQGGLGLVQRRPVYLPLPDGGERYWGSITAVADLDRFVRRAGLLESPIELALYERRGDGSPGQRIWGRAELLQERHLQAALQLPGAQWLLLGRPRGGWVWAWWQQPWLWGLGVLSGSLVAVSAALGLRRRQLLERSAELAAEVEARRLSQTEAEAARQRLQVLLATASDWYWEQDAELRLSYVAGSSLMAAQTERMRSGIGRRRWEHPFLVPGQPTEAAWAAHREQLAQRQPFRDFEYAMQAPGGALHWYSVSGDPMFDTEGRFCGYRGTGRDISRLRQLNDELLQTRDHLQAVLDSASEVAMIATDMDDRITDFNRGAERLLGYSPQEVLGSSPHRFHDPDELAQRAAERALQLGRPVAMKDLFTEPLVGGRPARSQTWTYLTRDGGRVPVALTVSELRDRNGGLLGHLGVAINLSEQLAAQAELRHTAQRLQAVLDSAEEVSIVAVDANGRVELFNRGAERILGCTAAEAIGRSPRRFHLESELQARADALSLQLGRPVPWHEVFERQAAGLDEGNTRVWTYVPADGSPHRQVLHTFSALRDPQGRVSGYLAFARDVTEQLRAQQELLETRDHLQAVLDSALDIGILVAGMDGRVRLFSRGAERLFGYAAAEVLGRSTLELHDPGELSARAAELSAELGRQVHRHEVFMLPLQAGEGASFSRWTFVRKNGEHVAGALRLRRMLDRDGQVQGFLVIAMDISAELRAQQALERLNHELEQRVEARTGELARAQEQLLRSERLAALGSLVAGVAHDLNTPIGTCMTAASTLHDRTRELVEAMRGTQLRRSTLQAYVDNCAGMTELLLRGLRDAADLVSHFKQLSIDQTSEHRRSFRLATVIDDVLTVMRPQLKQGHLEVLTELQLDTPIDGYPGELGRLLSNLIQNAQLHAYPPDEPGRLRISARPLEDGWFELVVADEGKGMSEEVRRRAFDPFFTTRMGKGGSGLGLNIVHNIATALLGGSVELISRPGGGSRFVFRLPLEAPRRKAAG